MARSGGREPRISWREHGAPEEEAPKEVAPHEHEYERSLKISPRVMREVVERVRSQARQKWGE